MKKEQFLLLKLAEECAEVAQRAIKQVQFGRHEIQTGQPFTNGERLKQELLDLNVIVTILQETKQVPEFGCLEFDTAYRAKKVKLQKYLDHSAALGMLPEITL